MKSTIITILKKELKRFFSDKRMAFTTILLPGIMIFIMYNFMGDAFSDMMTVDDEYVYSIECVNMPASIRTLLENTSIAGGLKDTDTGDGNEAKKELESKDSTLDLYIVFPENFENDIAVYNSTSGEKAPQVEVYYNSASTESQTAYKIFIEIMDSYESSMTNKYFICSL